MKFHNCVHATLYYIANQYRNLTLFSRTVLLMQYTEKEEGRSEGAEKFAEYHPFSQWRMNREMKSFVEMPPWHPFCCGAAALSCTAVGASCPGLTGLHWSHSALWKHQSAGPCWIHCARTCGHAQLWTWISCCWNLWPGTWTCTFLYIS